MLHFHPPSTVLNASDRGKFQWLGPFSCSVQPRNACRRRYRCLQLLGNNKRDNGRGTGIVLKFPDIVRGQRGWWALPAPCNFSLSLSVNNVQPPPLFPIFFFFCFLFPPSPVSPTLAPTPRFCLEDSITRRVTLLKRPAEFLINTAEIYTETVLLLSSPGDFRRGQGLADNERRPGSNVGIAGAYTGQVEQGRPTVVLGDINFHSARGLLSIVAPASCEPELRQ